MLLGCYLEIWSPHRLKMKNKYEIESLEVAVSKHLELLV